MATVTTSRNRTLIAWATGEEYGHIDANKVQTTLRCCKDDLEEWLMETPAKHQHLTSSEGWRLSCAEVAANSPQLLKNLRAQRPEPLIEGSQRGLCGCVTGKALPDSARKRKVKAKEMWKTRVKETRHPVDRLLGSRAQLPSGSEAVGNDKREEVEHCLTVTGASFSHQN